MATVPIAAASTPEGANCSCTRESWPWILFGLGFGAMVLTCVVAIMEIIGGETLYIVLNVYIFIFGILGAAAEIRMFKSLRGLMWYVVKYMYFLAKPWGKAFFYIFVASLTWTPDFKFLPMLTASLTASVAVMIIVVDMAIGLPVYADTEFDASIEGVGKKMAFEQAKKEVLGPSTAARI